MIYINTKLKSIKFADEELEYLQVYYAGFWMQTVLLRGISTLIKTNGISIKYGQ